MIGLFSRSIYPRRGASAVVTEELARCFARGEMVVVGGRKIFNSPMVRSVSDVEFLALGSEINIGGRAERFFELIRWLLFPLHLAQATAFCRRRGCDRIVATFPDEFYLLLGLMVAERLNAPLFAYFHNTMVENRKGWRALLARRIQKRVFESASSILVISEGMERFYREAYPTARFETVQHVFGEYPRIETGSTTRREKAIKTVALCGNFNETNLDATRRVINALHEAGGFEIKLFTPVPPPLLRLRGIDIEKVGEIGYVADSQFMARLAEADLLVLTHGLKGGLSDIEYQTIFPTRTVFLLLAGRPLLVHAPSNSFLADFVRERECGLVVDEPNEDALRQAARALTTDEKLARRLIDNARSATEMFHGPVVRARLLDAIQR